MTEHTYDVRIWATEKYVGKRRTSYKVVWWVGQRRFKESHRQVAAAESFRSELIVAQRNGEAFDCEVGLPVSKVRREAPTMTWYDFACEYVDMKWPHLAGSSRKGLAESLVSVTPAMLTEPFPEDEAQAFRSALQLWGFNKRRGTTEQPEDVTERLDWVRRYSRPLADVTEKERLRKIKDSIIFKLNGDKAAGSTARRKRAILHNALDYAVERDLLTSNPIDSIKWNMPKTSAAIDRRSVINQPQARALLRACSSIARSGPRLEAFFGVMYYSALRPEEAVNLRLANLDIQFEGWGWITLDEAAPDTGTAWSDSGRQRDASSLKHRASGDTRRTPCPPDLTNLLHRHLSLFGTDGEGRLFRGVNGGELATVVYLRAWSAARREALSDEQAESPLGKRPYDLRHAAVSTWLNGGVAPTQVAEWAGHSVDVLLKIYAKCLDGSEDGALRRISNILDQHR